MIDSLSITGLEYGTTFLAIQLFADFEIEYLSLPESYDNNFVIPCLTTLWSIWLRTRKKKNVRRKNGVIFAYRRRVAVDLRRTNVSCDNIYFKSSSLPPRKAFRMAYLSISMTYLFPPICIFLNTSFSKFYHSITIYTTNYYVTKKSLQCFVQRISRAYLENFIDYLILNNFRLSRLEETIKINKTKRNKK